MLLVLILAILKYFFVHVYIVVIIIDIIIEMILDLDFLFLLFTKSHLLLYLPFYDLGSKMTIFVFIGNIKMHPLLKQNKLQI